MYNKCIFILYLLFLGCRILIRIFRRSDPGFKGDRSESFVGGQIRTRFLERQMLFHFFTESPPDPDFTWPDPDPLLGFGFNSGFLRGSDPVP